MQNTTKIKCILVAVMLAAIQSACATFGKPAPTEAPPVFPTAAPQATTVPTSAPVPTADSTKIITARGGLQHAGFPSGSNLEINQLWVSPQGEVWVVTPAGVFNKTSAGWNLLLDERNSFILGADENGRVWSLTNHGDGVAAWDGSRWRTYHSAQGWTPLPKTPYLSPGVGDGLITDGGGYVWLATGGASVRRFNPADDLWEELPAADLNFTAVPEPDTQGYFLTDIATGPNDQVWVSGCLGEGESLFGDGIRRWSSEEWLTLPGSESACIFDMEASGDVVWAGTFNELWRFEGAPSEKTSIALPAAERSQFITKIDLDASGNPWLEVIVMGGASLYGEVRYLHLDGETWATDYAPGYYAPASRALDARGNAWFCKEGGLHRLVSGQLVQYAELETFDCITAVDGRGQVWVAVPSGSDAGLWVVPQTP